MALLKYKLRMEELKRMELKLRQVKPNVRITADNPDKHLLHGRKKQKNNRIGVQRAVTIMHLNAGHIGQVHNFLITLWKAMAVGTTNAQKLNAYLSFMYHMFGDQKEEFVSVLESSSCLVRKIMYPTDRDEIEICYPEHLFHGNPAYNNNEFFILFGIAMIIAFKNSTRENFVNFYKSRIEAMAGKVGVAKDSLPLPITLETAVALKSELGRFDGLKDFYVAFVLSDDIRNEAITSIIAAYVSEIIEWADMSGFGLIMRYILPSNSPILNSAEIANEIQNLAIALKELNNCDVPQFYRYYSRSPKMALFERNKFPVLIAVAQSLASDGSPSASQYTVPGNIRPGLVDDLLKTHHEYTKSAIHNRIELQPYLPKFADGILTELKDVVESAELTDERLSLMGRAHQLRSSMMKDVTNSDL